MATEQTTESSEESAQTAGSGNDPVSAAAATGPPTPKKKGDLVPRLITAAVAVPILLLLAFLGPNWGLWAILAGAAAIATYEFFRMTLNHELRAAGWIGVVGTAGILGAYYWWGGTIAYAATVGVVLTMLIAELFTLKDTAESARRITALLGGLTYCTVLFAGLVWLVADTPRTVTGQFQAGWFLLPCVTIWGGDTGAYFAGRAFGKNKLAPRVSPKKTIEGAIGGLVASVVGAMIVRFTLLPHIEIWQVVAIALPAAAIGQVGDLVESLIKRATGFKDSGTILYGHGGMLDRVDALMFAAPFFAIMKWSFGL